MEISELKLAYGELVTNVGGQFRNKDFRAITQIGGDVGWRLQMGSVLEHCGLDDVGREEISMEKARA